MNMKLADPAKSKPEPNSLEEWLDVLCNEEMPIFSNTAISVHNILSDEKKGATDLASVILQDPNLTVKLLKISNSQSYNPLRHKMVTVSRAVIVIGFEIIRKLTLACSFFESILSGTNKQQVNEEIARAILAAVHAKSIAIAAKDSSPEEVFIAALLKHLGSICFWSFCSEQGAHIQLIINRGNYSREDAERQVLGFELAELSACLSDAWQLGGLIEESIKLKANTPITNPRLVFIQLGYDIIEALKEGEDSKKYEDCISKVRQLTKQSRLVITENIKNNANVAYDIARQLGAVDAAILIQNSLDKLDDSDESLVVFDKKQLQFSILQDVASIISGRPDVNLLLETVLEGIHRSIGMDRTIFCVLAPDKRSLREKMSFGWCKGPLGHKVIFNISDSPMNLFFHVLSGTDAFWAKPSVNTALYTLMDINVVGKNECFMMPVFFKNTQIGLIYADRGIHKQSLTEEDFNTFKYFTQQANIGLTVFRMQLKL